MILKKIGISILMLMLSLLLISCSYSSSNSLPNGETQTNQNNQLKTLQLPTYAQILLFDNNTIVYSIEDVSTNPERPFRVIYQYNIVSGETIKLDKVFFPDPSTNSVTTIGDNLYMICATEDNNMREVREFDLAVGSSRVIYQWDEGSVFAYLYAIDQNLILFDISRESTNVSSTIYSIRVIDLTDFSVQTIVSKEFCNGAGTAISCIDVDEKNVYSYQINVVDGSVSYLIAGYDLTGDVIVEHPLDLSTFLLNDNAETRDSVTTIKKDNDYYILNTIQKRTKIWQEANQGLLPVSLPSDEFEGKNFLGQYAVMESFGKSDEIYFFNYGAEPSIYEFSTKTGEFNHYMLPGISNYSYYYMNDGRLLIKNVQRDENGLQSNATYCLVEQLS